MFSEQYSLSITYIDLEGNCQVAEILANNSADAISCIERAWNSHLLLYFKFNLGNEDDNKNEVEKHAILPWNTEDTSNLLILARIQKEIDSTQQAINHIKNDLIERYSCKYYSFAAGHNSIESLATRKILREAYSSLKKELTRKGVEVPEVFDANTYKKLEYIQRVSESLSEIKDSHPYDLNIRLLSISSPRYTPDQFLDHLPKLSDIFPSQESREEWLKLGG